MAFALVQRSAKPSLDRRQGLPQKPARTLEVSAPDDKFEKEADRIADVVLGGQRQPLARPAAATNIAGTLDSLKGAGAPLSGSTRAFFESRFSADFGSVRVHTGEHAAALAESVQARAFTSGRDIVFGMSEYAPQSQQGRRLLAHELTHVIQQSNGAASAGRLQRQPKPTTCNLQTQDLQTRLNEPLPWGIQPGDSVDQIDQKRLAMTKHADYLEIVNHCLQLTQVQSSAIMKAAGFSIQEMLDSSRSGEPFQVVKMSDQSQQLEAWFDPRKLPGSQKEQRGLRYIVTGPDAGQCGDTCTNSERRVSETDFADMDKPVRSCCETTHCDTIRERLGTAREYVNRTLARMRARGTMDTEMHRHFNRTGESAYLDVEEALRRVLLDIEFSRHRWFCRKKGEAGEACEKPVGGRAKQWRIMLCFDRGDIAWEEVLHEIMHTSGLATGIVEQYRFDTQFYPPPDALHNADSYAGFVSDTGKADWEEEKPYAFGLGGMAGLTLRGKQEPVLAARLEWSPLGPGLRVVDLKLGGSLFWSPTAGVLPGAAKFGVGAEAGLRLRPPSLPLVFDLDAGGLVGVGKELDLALTARFSAAAQIGSRDSGVLVGVNVQGIYDQARLQPDQVIFGVSVEKRFGKPPRRERGSPRR